VVPRRTRIKGLAQVPKEPEKPVKKARRHGMGNEKSKVGTVSIDKQIDMKRRTKFGLWKIVSDMLDKPDKHEIYPTSECYNRLDERVSELIAQAEKEGYKKGYINCGIDELKKFENANGEGEQLK